MPVYEFRGEDSGRVVEEVYTSWRDAPHTFVQDGEKFVRIPSRLARAVVVDEKVLRTRALEKRGIVTIEPGMDRDADNARRAREKKVDENRRKVIADTLSSF